MKVSLTAVTQSLIPKPGAAAGVYLSPDEHIVYVARVSNPSNQLNTETGPRLLAHCIRHNHWSIFEHVYLTFEIETSRAIAAQILRHRSFTFQEFSQRYSAVDKLGDDLFEPVELRAKAVGGNRQGSGTDVGATTMIDLPEFPIKANGLVENLLDDADRGYRALLEAGIAPECARMVLPLCTKTRLYVTGNVRSWIHYFAQRCDHHAQKEHRLLAKQIYTEFRGVLPTVAETLELIQLEREDAARFEQVGRAYLASKQL